MQYVLDSSGANPIDVDTAKSWLKVTHSYEDDLITSIVDSALSFAEEYTGMAFRDQSWFLYASAAELALGIRIVKTPFAGISSIVITLDDDTTLTLSEDQYSLSVNAIRTVLTLTDENAIDDASSDYAAVEISFTVSSSMPAHIENAVKMLISFMYENRGDAPTINNNSAPPEALKLLQIERVFQI